MQQRACAEFEPITTGATGATGEIFTIIVEAASEGLRTLSDSYRAVFFGFDVDVKPCLANCLLNVNAQELIEHRCSGDY